MSYLGPLPPVRKPCSLLRWPALSLCSSPLEPVQEIPALGIFLLEAELLACWHYNSAIGGFHVSQTNALACQASPCGSSQSCGVSSASIPPTSHPRQLLLAWCRLTLATEHPCQPERAYLPQDSFLLRALFIHAFLFYFC